jgi:hypothetical protein
MDHIIALVTIERADIVDSDENDGDDFVAPEMTAERALPKVSEVKEYFWAFYGLLCMKLVQFEGLHILNAPVTCPQAGRSPQNRFSERWINRLSLLSGPKSRAYW